MNFLPSSGPLSVVCLAVVFLPFIQENELRPFYSFLRNQSLFWNSPINHKERLQVTGTYQFLFVILDISFPSEINSKGLLHPRIVREPTFHHHKTEINQLLRTCDAKPHGGLGKDEKWSWIWSHYRNIADLIMSQRR